MKSSLPLLAAAGAAVLSSGCFSFRVGSLEPVDDGCEWVSSSKLVATESTAVSELEPLVVLPDAAERALSNGVSIGLTGKEELVETVEDTCMKAVVYRQRMMTFGLWPGVDEMSSAALTEEGWKDYWSGAGIGDVLGPSVGGVLALPVSVFVSPFLGRWECRGHYHGPGYLPGAKSLRNDFPFHFRFARQFQTGRPTMLSKFLHYAPFGFHRYAYHYIGPPEFSRTVLRKEKRQRPLSGTGPYRVRLELPGLDWRQTATVPLGSTVAKFALPVPDVPTEAEGFVRFLEPKSRAEALSPGMRMALDQVSGMDFPVSVFLRARAASDDRIAVVNQIHRIRSPRRKYEIETRHSSGGEAEYRVKVLDETMTKIEVANLVTPEIRRLLREDFLRENPGVDAAQVRAYVSPEFGKDSTIVLRGTAVSFEPVLEGWRYDPISRIGSVRIRVRARMDAERLKAWAAKNIGAIVEDKNVVLEVGKAPPPGAKYRSLDEKFEGGVLTVEFEAME